jgi:hypothetical protein
VTRFIEAKMLLTIFITFYHSSHHADADNVSHLKLVDHIGLGPILTQFSVNKEKNETVRADSLIP